MQAHSSQIPQCRRCQGFGHTKNYCSMDFRCVTCLGSHYYKDCPKNKDTSPTCVVKAQLGVASATIRWQHIKWSRCREFTDGNYSWSVSKRPSTWQIRYNKTIINILNSYYLLLIISFNKPPRLASTFPKIINERIDWKKFYTVVSNNHASETAKDIDLAIVRYTTS